MNGPSRNELIVEAWNAGLTGGQIAATFEISRSAVLGVVSRAKQARPGSVTRSWANTPRKAHERYQVNGVQVRTPARPPGRPAKDGRNDRIMVTLPVVLRRVTPEHSRKPAVLAARKAEAAKPMEPLDGVALVDLVANKGCRWVGEHDRFCNEEGFPYCPSHKAIVNPPAAQNYYGGKRAGNARKFA